MTTARRASASPYEGTGNLIRFALRRDRVKLPAWVLGLTVMVVYFNTALPAVLGSEEELRATGGFLTGPVGAIFGGPGYGFDDLTFARFFVGQYGLYVLIMAALMSILMVTRHTRVEEQSGRSELVRASVVGQRAPLTASLAVALVANVSASLLIFLALVGMGHDVGDSFLFGAGVGAVGLVFAGVAAVTAQVSEFSKTASGLAGIALGVAYALRAAGDAIQEHGSPLSWLSPLAWSQQTRAYVDGRWWPLLLSVLFTGVLVGISYALAGRRDFGAGLVRPRPGPAAAAGWLRTPLALALRLQRAPILGWAAALIVGGFAYGVITQPIVDAFSGDLSPETVEIFGGGGDLVSGYLATMGVFNTALVAVFVVIGANAIRSEELEGRTEPVLATATSRPAWLGSHLTVLALGSAGLLAVTGFATGLGAAIGTGEAALVWDVTAGHLAYLPAVLVILGFAGVLYGFRPGTVGLAWALVFYSFFMGFFAPLLDLPQWMLNISPMEHVAEMPLEEFALVPLAVLTAVAASLVALSLLSFRNRDLVST